MLRNSLLVLTLIVASNARTEAAFNVTLVNTSGTLPGSSIAYTITSTGMARAIQAGGATPNGVFNITSAINEFVAVGTEVTTITFSSAVLASQIVAGLNSFSNSTGSAYSLSVSGGTATTADFTLIDGLPPTTGDSGTGPFNPATGIFSPTQFDMGTILGSTSTRTLTTLTLTGNDPGDGYTEFFGFNTSAAVPEPSSLALCGIAGIVGVGVSRYRRRRVA